LASKLGQIAQFLLVVTALCPQLFSQAVQPGTNNISEELTLRIIVVSSPEQAQKILDELRNGEDFTTLARMDSIDSKASDGGYLGHVSLSALRPELRKALVGVAPGHTSPIVKSPLGFAILKVEAEPAPASSSSAVTTGTPATNSSGSVKPTWGVGGFVEAEAGLYNLSKPAGWDRDPKQICGMRKQSQAHVKDSLARFFSPEGARDRESMTSIDLLNSYYSFAEIYSYKGDMERSMPQYDKAHEIAATRETAAEPQMDEALGVAYLHKSEMENGVYRSPSDRCLLPMKPSSAYPKKEDSRKAIEYFLKHLEQQPDDLEVQWLNLAYMTVGGYPDEVPAKYRISPKAFESSEDVGRFRDVALEAGLESFSTAGGVIVDDFENIGRFDVVTSSFYSCGPMHLFHNNGDGTFTEQTVKAGLADQLRGLNILQTDYNNDGCLDILVLRGGWEIPQRKSLLRNNCDGTFTDVTVASGLGEPTATQTAVWTDINNDGFLDLFVGNEGQPAQLFLNKGDGTFQDISASAGVNRKMFTKGVTAGDYDNDGFPDLYVSNFGGGDNILYHNNHDNTFTEVTQAAGVPGPGRGFATWFFDYDNDGLPDIFATSYFLSMDETARTYLGLPHNAATLKLYKNLGDGTFRDVTTEVELDKVYMPMGANFGDIDNDGFLDIFLGTGNPSYTTLKPSVLLHNKDGKRFVDVTNSSGTGEWHKGHGVAFADLDNRGDEDIIFEVGGATIGDSHMLRVFENPGHGNDWISLKLVGTKTNRAAIGARIKVTVENKGQGVRSIYRTVGSGGSFGASPLQQHIGLGKDARILDVEVWWPASNTRQHFLNIAKNQFLESKEFAQDYAKLDRKPYRLGGEKRNASVLAQQPETSPTKGN
jgi:tetratricopeptide (TPR) repeat protein